MRYLNRKYGADIPLVLMNSFNTNEMTAKLIKKYDGDDVDIKMFEQSVAPRISRESLLPVPNKPEVTEGTKQNWWVGETQDRTPSTVPNSDLGNPQVSTRAW